jgi:hypothetical protein
VDFILRLDGPEKPRHPRFTNHQSHQDSTEVREGDTLPLLIEEIDIFHVFYHRYSLQPAVDP